MQSMEFSVVFCDGVLFQDKNCYLHPVNRLDRQTSGWPWGDIPVDTQYWIWWGFFDMYLLTCHLVDFVSMVGMLVPIKGGGSIIYHLYTTYIYILPFGG